MNFSCHFINFFHNILAGNKSLRNPGFKFLNTPFKTIKSLKKVMRICPCWRFQDFSVFVEKLNCQDAESTKFSDPLLLLF